MRRRVGTIFPICAQGRFEKFAAEPGPCRLGVDHSLPRVSYREESRSRPNKSEEAGACYWRLKLRRGGFRGSSLGSG